MQVTINHNPACGTFCTTLPLIRNAGIEPTIIAYLVSPPDKEMLRAPISKSGLSVRDAIREMGTPYAETGLDGSALRGWDNSALSDERQPDALMSTPILINRPFVVTPWDVRLCSPSEDVLDILPVSQRCPFSREDGEPVIDAGGKHAMP